MAIDEMIGNALRLAVVAVSIFAAYRHRLYAIETYGLVIHEFDPWFNYRATEYLAENGLTKFFQWFDYESWYPLGRPVGTTIYPGMQMSSVFIWKVINGLGVSMSLNDVCCMVPAWFGGLATGLLVLLTKECSGSSNAAVIAGAIMAVVPAHMMRSVGGGYDNESVAMSAMVLTFYLWCRSLRDESSWPFGLLTAAAYTFMAAAWGGYIFVLGLIGLHALALTLMGKYSDKLHRAFSLFYFFGTMGAMQVPVVGWTPLKSLEQLPCLAIFLLLQAIALSRFLKDKYKMDSKQFMALQQKMAIGAAVAAAVVVFIIIPTGYFGPLSSRVRGLFLKHTRTGNPLVDSVAEHQPASSQAYYQYLHVICYIAPFGWLITLANFSDANSFLALYGIIAYFFSAKMVRLVLLLGPIASALGGLTLAKGTELAIRVIRQPIDTEGINEATSTKAPSSKGKRKAPRIKGSAPRKSSRKKDSGDGLNGAMEPLMRPFVEAFATPKGGLVAKSLAVLFVVGWSLAGMNFYSYSVRMAVAMSNPSIMYQATLRNGETIIVDDYREAYWWLRDNTPEDSRVMAWWDYGYQITGIAKRTTIADGNTWNHEHIATLGRCLVSPEKKAHKIVRHLADYVLVWSGGGGDDLAKSPHMARITNSVYSDICPNDPTCRKFGFMNREGTPKPMMAASLLYKLHSHRQKPGVMVDPNLFEEVYTSKYNKVRIFKVLNVDEGSRKWVADKKNRICDAPGSWYCTGQYPPAVQKMFGEWGKKNFAQLEDFNAVKDEKGDQYHEDYMNAMSGRAPKSRPGDSSNNNKPKGIKGKGKDKGKAVGGDESAAAAGDDADEFDDENDWTGGGQDFGADHKYEWENTADTTQLWQLIDADDIESLRSWIGAEPYVVHLRSEDGRGPLWWAYENGRTEIAALLIASGTNPDEEDSKGMKPSTMRKA